MQLFLKKGSGVYSESSLDRFLSIAPYHKKALDSAKKNIQNKIYPRKKLVEVLLEYNGNIGNDAKAIENIQSLSQVDKFCVVTGQQLGFMTGPSYTVLKAISCILLANDVGAVPVFWLATEDHDVAEIDHANLIDDLGNIAKKSIALPRDGRSVEDLPLSSENRKLVELFLKECALDKWKKLSKPDKSYTETMIALLVTLFKGTGLVILEPKCLRHLSIDLFTNEIIHHKKNNAALINRSQELSVCGGEVAINFQNGQTNLFMKDDFGVRRKITANNSEFFVGDINFKQEDLLALIKESPERFSTNVAARPLFQCMLIPTLAYVAGPGEINYHRQLGSYFELNGMSLPWIVPRLSLTFVTEKAERYLEFVGKEAWEEIPHDWSQVLTEMKGNDSKKDQKIKIKKYLKTKGVPYNALHYLNNLLLPHGKLQERSLNWLWFQSQSTQNLINELLLNLTWNAKGHYYFKLKV